jgi:adenylate cyclase
LRFGHGTRPDRYQAAHRLYHLGEQQVKNISQPVHVYRVAASRATQAAEAPAAAPLLPDKPSIAVLAFTNISGDPEQEFFSYGVAEDIITALSRYPSLFVIARNSSFTYKGSRSM